MRSESLDVQLKSAAELLFTSFKHSNAAHRAAYAYHAAQKYQGILDGGSGNSMVYAMVQAAHNIASAASVEVRRCEPVGLTTIEELLDCDANSYRKLLEQRYVATLKLLDVLNLLEQNQTPKLILAAQKSIDQIIKFSYALLPIADEADREQIAEDVAYFRVVKNLL